jgi:hypothetical protein
MTDSIHKPGDGCDVGGSGYPEGFDSSCGLSVRAMRTANGLMAAVIGKREWDVPMVAAALESFANSHWSSAELTAAMERSRAYVSWFMGEPQTASASSHQETVRKLREALEAFMALDKSFSTICDEHLEEMASDKKRGSMAHAVKLARAALKEATS